MSNINNIHQDRKVNISVKNFGPISEANIDLRPLTVFIGPSNTGKTYFSSLICALHYAFDGFSGFSMPFLQDLFADIAYELTVSELAPLVLFIRGLIQPGDTLIIEEPEAHLHPGAQTEIAATLARLVRAGVRVVVTTHSDWLLKEIGNLIREGILKEKGELRKKSDGPESWLLPDEVGAWHFDKANRWNDYILQTLMG